MFEPDNTDSLSKHSSLLGGRAGWQRFRSSTSRRPGGRSPGRSEQPVPSVEESMWLPLSTSCSSSSSGLCSKRRDSTPWRSFSQSLQRPSDPCDGALGGRPAPQAARQLLVQEKLRGAHLRDQLRQLQAEALPNGMLLGPAQWRTAETCAHLAAVALECHMVLASPAVAATASNSRLAGKLKGIKREHEGELLQVASLVMDPTTRLAETEERAAALFAESELLRGKVEQLAAAQAAAERQHPASEQQAAAAAAAARSATPPPVATPPVATPPPAGTPPCRSPKESAVTESGTALLAEQAQADLLRLRLADLERVSCPDYSARLSARSQRSGTSECEELAAARLATQQALLGSWEPPPLSSRRLGASAEDRALASARRRHSGAKAQTPKEALGKALQSSVRLGNEQNRACNALAALKRARAKLAITESWIASADASEISGA